MSWDSLTINAEVSEGDSSIGFSSCFVSSYFSASLVSFFSICLASSFFSTGLASSFFSFGLASSFFSAGLASSFFSTGLASFFASGFLSFSSDFFSVFGACSFVILFYFASRCLFSPAAPLIAAASSFSSTPSGSGKISLCLGPGYFELCLF